ncbi:MAG: hypothetical protein U0M06_02290 [Clostridia bacterium]|nr:hypothetical protein [Clostridia bacterium]
MRLWHKSMVRVLQLTDEIIFEYRTYQGNKKKAFFKSFRYAEEALKKYIKNPDMYYIVSIEGGAE